MQKWVQGVKHFASNTGLRNWALQRKLNKGAVLTGPFKGTRLSMGSDQISAPKLVGTYEKELHPVWATLLRKPLRTALILGTAEGFFVAALARLQTSMQFIAWEAEASMQENLKRTLQLNKVSERVEIRALATEAELLKLPEATKQVTDLIVCDIEGGEQGVITPAVLQAFPHATFITETHSTIITEALEARIEEAGTHTLQRINNQPRTLADWPLPRYVVCSQAKKEVSMAEWRKKPTPWLIAHPIKN